MIDFVHLDDFAIQDNKQYIIQNIINIPHSLETVQTELQLVTSPTRE